MKINRLIGLLACTMAFIACQDDMLEGSMQQNKIYTLTGKMSGGNTMSRAQIALGNNTSGNGEIAYWNEGDEFSLYQFNEYGFWNENVFTISSDYREIGQNTSASFTTETPVEPGSYVAVYPGYRTVFDGGYVTCQISNYTSYNFVDQNPDEVWKQYFNNNMFMLAKGTLSENDNEVDFKHLTSLFRITYTNVSEESQNVIAVLLGGDQHFRLWNQYSLEDGTIVNEGGITNDYCTWYEGLTVAPGNSADFYIFSFPTAFDKGNMDITFIINKGDHDEYKTAKIAIADIASKNPNDIGFKAGKRYWFRITDFGRNICFDKDYTTDVVTIENPGLSLALKDVLENEGIPVELDSVTGFANINELDLSDVTSLNFSYRFNISSLAGIEHFKNLEALQCSGVGLTSCDLSNNPKIFYLDLAWNNLSSLDLSKHSELQYLNCSFNENLSELKIAEDCNSLHTLNVENTKLETLEVPCPSLIETLYYGNTGIEPFDLTGYDNLKTLDLDNMGLENLNLIPSNIKAQLETLFVDDNRLSDLDLKEFPMLRDLHCHRNNIEKLAVPASPELRSLMCTGNKIDSLDISGWNHIGYLECGNQQDTSKPLILTMTQSLLEDWKSGEWDKNSANNYVEPFVLSNTITIKNLELTLALQTVLGADTVKIDSDYGYGLIDGNIALEIKELNFNEYEGTISSLYNGIEFFKNLIKFECRDVNLKTCDLSKNIKLTYVDVQNNDLTSLNLEGCENLKELFCQNNTRLETLILTGCTMLSNFQAQETALTSLDIPNPSVMDNMLLPTEVGIDNWINWATFTDMFSNLTGLGLQNKANVVLNDIPQKMRHRLNYLNVNNTELTALDLNLFPNLIALDCSGNSIIILDLKVTPNLQTLHCMENQIAELDITELSGLSELKCGSQGAEGDKMLTLKLTTEQMSKWSEEWEKNGCNEGVTLEVIK